MTRLLRLDGATTTLLIAIDDDIPFIAHWGPRLPADEEPSSLALVRARPLARAALDRDAGIPLLPDAGDGYGGATAFSMHRAGADFVTRLRLVSHDTTGTMIDLALADPARGIAVTQRLGIDPATDMLTASLCIRNTGSGTLDLTQCDTLVLPLSADLTEIVASGGRWCRETILQHAPMPPRAYLAEQRTGRTSHANTPALTICDRACNEDTGTALSAALAWSGNHRVLVDRLADGRRALHVGALFLPGEIRLAPGESWNAPAAHATRSDSGLNGLRQRWHEFVRTRVLRPFATSRRVHLNTWEAVYFDHDPARLASLVDAAADLGVERFVLDDGWFAGRTDDRRALGDWTPDPLKYPDGLGPLIDHVHARGMDFGLWIEPEMVNPNSALFRAHPDWILSAPDMPPVTGRFQYVLDLARDEVFAYLHAALDLLLRANAIAYLKWDMNRDLTAPGHDGRASVDRQTRALYRLLDRLRADHPAVEIESCASGGGRADLGILARTDRIWTSDTNDALERLAITGGFGLYLPPEVMGAHIGPPRAHTTGRTLDLAFQASVSMFGHLGLELDATALGEVDRDTVRRWIARYKAFRPLLHQGRTRMLPSGDPGIEARAVVAHDRGQALVLCARTVTSEFQIPPPQRITGLDPDARYAVRIVEIAGSQDGVRGSTSFLDGQPATLSGAALAHIGVQLPALSPASSVLFHLSQEDQQGKRP